MKVRQIEEKRGAGSMSKNSNSKEDEAPPVASKAEAEETEPLVPNAVVPASPAKVLRDHDHFCVPLDHFFGPLDHFFGPKDHEILDRERMEK